MKKIVGIIPASGIGSRLHSFSYPKELLPVFFISSINKNKAYPMVAAEYSIFAMQFAKIKSLLITISERKTEIARYFGDGSNWDMNIAYLQQVKPLGLPHAINLGFEWVTNNYVCLALPDTIFYPFNAIKMICKDILDRQVDIVLGVFPTSKPEQLGPVNFNADGTVLEVLDKPTNSSIHNTWGIAVWSPIFSQFLRNFLEASIENRERPLGYIFNLALENGLKVKAHFFESGSYYDLGTTEGLASLLLDNKFFTLINDFNKKAL